MEVDEPVGGTTAAAFLGIAPAAPVTKPAGLPLMFSCPHIFTIAAKKSGLQVSERTCDVWLSFANHQKCRASRQPARGVPERLPVLHLNISGKSTCKSTKKRARFAGPRVCAECGQAAKYTCPACQTQTCSLPCSKGGPLPTFPRIKACNWPCTCFGSVFPRNT